MKDPVRFGIRWVVALGVLAAACVPQGGSQPAGRADQPQSPAQRKVLNLAGGEGNIEDFPGVTGGSTSCTCGFVHDRLVRRNDKDVWIPELAAELPDVERGTWRLNPDGTMDITWKLRPSTKWHDGTPFTSSDLLFTFTAFKDPELPSRYGAALKLMESAAAPDPLTFNVHWSRPFVAANEAPALIPMASHLLEDVYRSDKANFGNSSRLSTEFVGLGPYKLMRWEPGSHMEFARFDDYYRGRPLLDQVIVRFVDDPNTIVASVLAGAIDVSWGDVSIDTALEVRQRWEGTGNRVLFGIVADLAQLEIQHRPAHARPRNGPTNRDVREALYRAIDRTTMVEAATQGVTPVADSWLRPDDPRRPQLESAIPRYPYDPGRAQQLLAQAGWTRGTDGVLVHSGTGERFEIELYNQDRDKEQTQLIIVDYWKAAGIQAAPGVLPRPRDREFESLRPGPLLTSPKAWDVYRLDSRAIALAADRWTGRNRGGYENRGVTAILERLDVTIDSRERLDLERQLLREALGDVAVIPLHFDVNPILMTKGVKGPGHGTYVAWNFFEWDKDPSGS